MITCLRQEQANLASIACDACSNAQGKEPRRPHPPTHTSCPGAAHAARIPAAAVPKAALKAGPKVSEDPRFSYFLATNLVDPDHEMLRQKLGSAHESAQQCAELCAGSLGAKCKVRRAPGRANQPGRRLPAARAARALLAAAHFSACAHPCPSTRPMPTPKPPPLPYPTPLPCPAPALPHPLAQPRIPRPGRSAGCVAPAPCCPSTPPLSWRTPRASPPTTTSASPPSSTVSGFRDGWGRKGFRWVGHKGFQGCARAAPRGSRQQGVCPPSSTVSRRAHPAAFGAEAAGLCPTQARTLAA